MILKDSTKDLSAEAYVILGVTIDNKLTFYNHLKNLCKKIANKLNALTRIAPYLNHNQIRLINNSFFKGQLSYCPLIWKFGSMRSNHLINKLHEQVLRIAYNDFNSSFSGLLEMANESKIHTRNLKFLLTEVYKFLNGSITNKGPQIWLNISLEINSESLKSFPIEYKIDTEPTLSLQNLSFIHS